MTRARRAALAALALAAGAAAVLRLDAPPVPSAAFVRRMHRSSEALLLDRHGEVVHELRVDARGRRLDWIPLGEISPAFVSAVVRAEDRRFRAHAGVDWPALAAAAARRPFARRPRGASTITMQLAAMLDDGIRPRARRRSLAQKARQLRWALALERSWSKDEILEAYLNLIGYRGELQGIAAAARGLFRKEPHGLDAPEALVLAALPRSPGASIERVARRAAALGAAMGASAGEPEIRRAAAAALAGPPLIRPEAALAPHVARRLLKPGVARVGSTLDAGLQAYAREALAARLSDIREQNARDGAALVVENATGEVLAYVGNRGAGASARFVDGVLARRQAGSTVKPLLYAAAFDRRVLTPASVLDDSPLDLFVGRGVFRPQNYDKRFRGPVSARVALAASINVPAVRALSLVGPDAFVGTLRDAGFGELDTSDFYGPSLALGSADVTLWELVAAYRALADGGVYGELTLTPGRPAGARRRVVSREAAYLVADILSDRESRSATFGLESALATRFWTAVKTGTSKDMRDNWCVGWSERYTVGVWVGNFDGEPMWSVSGVSGAAPAWLDLMARLHRDAPSRAPKPPPGLVARRVRAPGAAQAREEWFLRGTEPAAEEVLLSAGPARISYPSSGTVFALDYDIPDEREAVFFEARPASGELAWRLNGEPLGSAGAPVAWRPRPGRYTLALAGPDGRALDAVGFEVRGEEAGEGEAGN